MQGFRGVKCLTVACAHVKRADETSPVGECHDATASPVAKWRRRRRTEHKNRDNEAFGGSCLHGLCVLNRFLPRVQVETGWALGQEGRRLGPGAGGQEGIFFQRCFTAQYIHLVIYVEVRNTESSGELLYAYFKQFLAGKLDNYSRICC